MKYIGFYTLDNILPKRIGNLAACAKMDYISELIVESGNTVEIISPSWLANQTIKKDKKREVKISNNKKVILPSSKTSKSKIGRVFTILHSLFFILNQLLFKTKKGETVIAYHALWLSFPLVIAKKLKKFNLVLELEEVYQDIWQTSKVFKNWENKVIKIADKFILSTELLADKIGGKPYMVVNGTYKTEPNIIKNKTNGKITLVYAGLIDTIKGGAFISIESMKYLNENYHLKIIGFGSNDDINLLKKSIDKINMEKGYACCEFCGEKRGKEYTDFVKKCDIALNPQKITEFAKVEFPSKVLSYLSMGKRVVSSPISCLTHSKINDLITYSEDDTSNSFANAIKEVDFNSKFNPVEKLNKLHVEAVKDLRRLINE
jgi:hypothetical protein